MFVFQFPRSDSALLLALPWPGLPEPLRVLLLVLVCLIPLGLILWLYRYELRLVARLTATGLLAFRVLVLFLALFLVVLQPVVGRTVTEHLPGRVLIAVDRSDSMDVTDPQRHPMEKLRLARALHLAGPFATDAQLDAWIQQYQDKGTPEWVSDKEYPNEPERRQRLAEERQIAHDVLCKKVDELTRSEVARRVLSADGVRLLDTVAGKHKVEVIGFAQDTWDVKPEQLADLFKQLRPNPDAAPDEKPKEGDKAVPGAAGAPPGGQPAHASGYTDVRAPLEQALKRSGHDQGKILGVVLLTDGQHNWGPSPVKKALELGEHHLPIYPVALGAHKAPPDVALVSVKAPPAVFKDVDAGVDARFKISGLPAQDVVVELARPGQPPLEEHIDHDGTDRYYTVHFQIRLDKAGTQALTVAARPVAGETRTDNNSQPLVINVADDKAKVLVIDGEARWEYHYLAKALERDRAMDVHSVVFRQPRLGKIPEDELEKVGNPSLTLPAEPDALSSYDCIILGDVSPEQLPPADRVRLEKYVADRGGTLVLLAGKRSMPLAYAQGGKAGEEDEDPLLRLLPLEQPRAVNPRAGFPVTLTEEGKLSSFLQMDTALDESARRWAELPRHFWGVIGKAKPGATPLAYLEEDGEVKKEKKDQVEWEKDHALIVRQNYGFGRVLFVGLDSTWRWRYKVGDTYHHRFWGQAIRWAASDKPLVAGNRWLRFGTREPVFQQGQEVEVVVRLHDSVDRLAPDAFAAARMLRQKGGANGEDAVALVPLKALPAQPRVLTGKVRDLMPGQYEIELVVPELADKLQAPPGADGKPGKLRASFTVTAPEGEERVELATNWPLLEELASKSGGKVFTPEDAPKLVDLLTSQSIPHVEHFEFRLRQWWVTLLVFVGLLTLEWVARKWAGLP